MTRAGGISFRAHGNAKLTLDQLAEFYRLLGKGVRPVELAAHFGICRTTAYRYAVGKRRRGGTVRPVTVGPDRPLGDFDTPATDAEVDAWRERLGNPSRAPATVPADFVARLLVRLAEAEA
jgi:hypothetical protein